MPPKPLAPDLFRRLREVLRAIARDYTVQCNTDDVYSLTMKGLLHRKKPIFFAAVECKTNYVGFNFMPLCICPSLQQRIPPQLRKIHHGYNCFHFTEADETTIGQLKTLVAAGAAAYPAGLKAAGFEISRD